MVVSFGLALTTALTTAPTSALTSIATGPFDGQPSLSQDFYFCGDLVLIIQQAIKVTDFAMSIIINYSSSTMTSNTVEEGKNPTQQSM